MSLLMLSVGSFTSAAETDWINIDTSEMKDKNGQVESTFTFEWKSDDFSNQSFDTPFLITGRSSHSEGVRSLNICSLH